MALGGIAAACGGGSTSDVVRFSGIPDADKAALSRMYAVVASYLSTKLGRKVEYVHVPDYTAVVTALAANKLDFAWLGGVTAVQAEARTQGKVEFVATRAADLKFKSYFIAQREFAESKGLAALDNHGPQTLKDLAALREALAGAQFTFGSKSSTSGHIMPRHFLQSEAVGIVPEKHFGKVGYQLAGGHSATLRAVAGGAAQVGALNFKTWDKADAETKAAAPVVYVTPEYVDYCLVAHKRMGADSIAKLRSALVELDGGQDEDAAVLEAFSAKRFVAAQAEQWQGIRDVWAQLEKSGTLG